MGHIGRITFPKYIVKVEPSGHARWNASLDHADGGDQPWKSTRACIAEAAREWMGPPPRINWRGLRSQYYCHAYGSVGIPGTSKWAGGSHWDLEPWRSETWNRWTWARNRCNW
ncbi:MAG: hypothetical protein JWM47_1779 [Acidimicrobiales bacterium]|nr:hypothetical protein [Acidimicrobiales bacterium]